MFMFMRDICTYICRPSFSTIDLNWKRAIVWYKSQMNVIKDNFSLKNIPLHYWCHGTTKQRLRSCILAHFLLWNINIKRLWIHISPYPLIAYYFRFKFYLVYKYIILYMYIPMNSFKTHICFYKLDIIIILISKYMQKLIAKNTKQIIKPR